MSIEIGCVKQENRMSPCVVQSHAPKALVGIIIYIELVDVLLIKNYVQSAEIAALVSADKNGESFCRHVATNLAILAA